MSEHLERSHREIGVGNSRVIAGGELCAVCHNKTVQNMKNKTSLYLAIFVASLFIIPQITLAAWWNPASWFEREKMFQLNATSTKNKVLESAIILKSHNISSSTTASFSKTENKPSELVNTVLDKSNTEDVAELKATIFQLQKEITLLQNKEQTKKVPAESIEKIIYRDRIIEKPIENIVYRDNIIEKPTEKIIYQDRVIEKPVEKVVYKDQIVEKVIYKDRIIQESCAIQRSSSVASSEAVKEYSDYNFDYNWDSYGVLSCPSTPRSIVLKKAVIKISDEGLQTLKALEKDPIHTPVIYRLHGVGIGSSYSKDYVNLERQDDYTFVFFGGSIPLNCSGTYNSIYIDIGVSSDMKNASTPTVNSMPDMSEWEVWDNTTNKPVKIQ